MAILSALLLIGAQGFAHSHLHVEVVELSLPDCTDCVLAKVPLAPVTEASGSVQVPMVTEVLPQPPAAGLSSVSSRFYRRAREPPGNPGAA